ncbi:hypothetical protein [Falsirhodobacter xinxiangensis]|uniref:hypothetical protein n=1 Tax=Falsirhodobacter xinxiangensis TaxID=2530049 RepID=UPI0010AA0831|nr:hypothetical protein [Rhodobacter xinxiangensis]
MEALIREVTAPLYDPQAVANTVTDRNKSRSWTTTAESVEAAQKDARRAARSADWSDLDALALRRAAAWIVYADGFGRGVTEGEARSIISRDPDRIATAARKVTGRLADEIPPPEIDGTLVAGYDLFTRLIA